MNRRDMLKTSSVAGLGTLGGFAFTAPSCDKPKNLSTWVTIIVADFTEMKPLLPELGLSQATIDRVSGFIDKAVKVARDFDAAYVAGKFADAVTLFTSLGDIVAQIASDLGAAENRIVKLALISIRIARIAIASLLSSQASEPQVAAAVRAARTTRTVSEIERLANSDLSKIEKALP
jgi:hypothetical protein